MLRDNNTALTVTTQLSHHILDLGLNCDTVSAKFRVNSSIPNYQLIIIHPGFLSHSPRSRYRGHSTGWRSKHSFISTFFGSPFSFDPFGARSSFTSQTPFSPHSWLFMLAIDKKTLIAAQNHKENIISTYSNVDCRTRSRRHSWDCVSSWNNNIVYYYHY